MANKYISLPKFPLRKSVQTFYIYFSFNNSHYFQQWFISYYLITVKQYLYYFMKKYQSWIIKFSLKAVKNSVLFCFFSPYITSNDILTVFIL